MGYDRKYGRVTLERGTIGDDEPVMVFRAQDALAPAMMAVYYELCELAGSPQHHLAGVAAAREAFLDWQQANPTKVPESSQ